MSKYVYTLVVDFNADSDEQAVLAVKEFQARTATGLITLVKRGAESHDHLHAKQALFDVRREVKIK